MIAMPSSDFFKNMSPMMDWKTCSSRGKRASWFSPSLFIQLFPQLFPFVFHHFSIFSPSNSLNHQFLSVTSTSTEDSGTHETHAVSHTTKVAAYLDDYQFLQKKIPHRKSTDSNPISLWDFLWNPMFFLLPDPTTCRLFTQHVRLQIIFAFRACLAWM